MPLPPTSSRVSPPDRELLQQFLDTKDSAPLNALVTRHAALVAGVCRRMLGASSDADDAFQATFLVLVQSANRIHRPDSCAGWLYGVAVRVCQRVRRHAARRGSIGWEEEPQQTNEPWQNVATRHELMVLNDELARLPERCRTALTLHHLEGAPLAEIALALQTTPAAVDGLLKRGRRELRVRLTRRGIELTIVMAALERHSATLAASDFTPLVDRTIFLSRCESPPASPVTSVSTPFQLARQELSMMTFSTLLKATAATATAATLYLALPVWAQDAALPASGQQFSSVVAIAADDAVPAEVAAPATPAPASPALASPRTGGFPGAGVGMGPSGFDVSSTPVANPNIQQKSLGLIRSFARRSTEEQRLESVLQSPATFEFQDQALEDVLTFIEESHEINLMIDQVGLADNGIALDTPVTLTLKGLPLHTCMNLLLPPLDLDYLIRDGVVMITSSTVADEYQEIRVYDVSQLDIDPASLVDIVQEMCDTEWLVVDGAGGAIKVLPDCLIVNQDQKTHRQIEGLLELLSSQNQASDRISNGVPRKLVSEPPAAPTTPAPTPVSGAMGTPTPVSTPVPVTNAPPAAGGGFF